MITINSFGTELSKDDRVKLFPTCGKLYPEGLSILAKADEYDQVKAVADYYTVSLSDMSLCAREFNYWEGMVVKDCLPRRFLPRFFAS